MKRILLLAAILSTVLSVQAQMRYLKGTLSGSNEVPPVTTTAGGVVIVNITLRQIAWNCMAITRVSPAI
jgi:hypothetical protein